MGNQENVHLNPPIVEKQASTPGYAWVVLLVAYIASIICSINFMKVPPLMPVLMGQFKVDLASAGLMMAVIAFTGLALGLPAGIIVQKLGIKVVGIIAMAFSTAGCVMGAMATNYPVFLVSRGLEGVGFTLIALVGATTAGIWFPPHKVGVAMGMISTCIGVGGFLVMAIAPRMTQSMGWQSVWWLTAALSFASLVSVAIFIKMPPWMTAASASLAGAPAPKGPGVGEGFANRNIWLWAVAYLCVFIPAILFMYYMTYLTKAQGFSLEKAGMVSSLGSVGSLIGAPLAGFLIGKLGHLKISLTAGILLYCVLILLAFNVTGIMIPIWMVLVGIVGLGFIPVVCMSAVPGIMLKPQLIGIGMAIAGFGANVAGMIGPPFFGRIVEKAGWNAGAYALIPVALVGIIFVHMTKIAE